MIDVAHEVDVGLFSQLPLGPNNGALEEVVIVCVKVALHREGLTHGGHVCLRVGVRHVDVQAWFGRILK